MSMNVLFIEDDPMNRRVVRDMLNVANVVMDEAGDAETGLEMLETRDYQALLIDLRMPGMNGIAAGEVRPARPLHPARCRRCDLQAGGDGKAVRCDGPGVRQAGGRRRADRLTA